MLPIVCKKLLVLTRVRCCKRGAALGVVSFVGGNDLWVSSGDWDVVLLVVSSLLMKQLLFRKMCAKFRIHNSRSIVFDWILARHLRQIGVRSWDWWHNHRLFIATVRVPIEVISAAGNDSTRSVVELPLAEQSSLLLPCRLLGSLLLPTRISFVIVFHNSLKLVSRMIRWESLHELGSLSLL